MNKQTQLRRGPVVAIALGLCFIGGAQAQLCFDVFFEDDSPFLQCADTDFFLAPTDGGFDNITEFTGSDTGELDAAFDGGDLFDPGDPELARPGNVLEPYFSSVDLTTTAGPSGSTTSFTTSHRGSVSMAPADSLFQSTSYGTRSRITFMPVNLVDPGAPITITLEMNITFSLTDPLENAGTGAALGGFGIKLFGGDDDPLDDPDFDVSALAELDLDVDTFGPEFYGFDDPDFDDATVEIDFAPPEPEIDDEFDIEIDIELELDIDDFDLDLDEPIVLETDTFGSVFSDGFESGDVAAWEAKSPGTFTFTVSSPDPNVRFTLVGAPGPPPPFAITAINRAADGQSFDLTWRSRPGEKFTVRHSKDLKAWDSYLVEDIDAGAGATTSFEYLIGDVPELVGAERVYFRVERR